MHEIDTILSTLRLEADPSLSPLFLQFEELYERKLWHQLTQSLILFFQDPKSVPLRLRVYDTFVTKFLDKINQLDVVEFLLLSLKNHNDYSESLHYLKDLEKSFDSIDSKKKRNDGLKNHNDSLLLIKIEIARIYLYQNDLVQSRDILDDLENTLDSKDTVPLRVTSAFYNVNSEYYRIKKDFNSFYYTSLLYLSTLDLTNDDVIMVYKDDFKELAYNLSIAALLGDKIYNFGELLNHQITTFISGNSEYQWLIQLLNALTLGDFKTFDSLISVQIPKIQILSEHESFLRQKICLMTLIEIVFEKNIRNLSFDDIATSTHLSKDNVEHLVMKAISLGLLKGSIDQVNELVSITWVQPRIINSDQISKMKDRLVEWDEQVSKLGEKIENHGRSIWV
ncbi:hypothetical protein Kpol_1023p96 [Vanderwaltozyma polyspora DSM 70294]|uniref:PCI domain-containing protein n=1 Tax=Vanderwaltozyma polyspora (strain ATCC 22028 / DSM 70294 / BCRC 21397 / CBS 2163 / NBRC 10782 / NRRL Y-8283 / UCD 57-17) TaxID=436907 RepID=A7TFW5_VANPO|nr:uncharacterized protein Kpol_1023p96 [Vanderwaltozyma polyspora DSM 70294]EDO18923.1 hypothetical protein Kpol_1023p96 [Vanderwaltozyma polyspora DSM 70294]